VEEAKQECDHILHRTPHYLLNFMKL
jgi:hypothetical protein